MFQNEVNDHFLYNLTYMLNLSPEGAENHFDTCLELSYKNHRQYPNYWACRKGLSMVSKTIVWRD